MPLLRSLAPLLLVGCGFLDAPGDPTWYAHRGGAALWPENSRTSVAGALAAGVAGIEVDLFLTGDRVPVLAHDPYLNPTTCRTADDQEITDTVWLMEHTLDELDALWRCGTAPDPDFPDAAVVPDTLMTFDELIEALADHPEVSVQLDVKYTENVSHDPEVFAAEILERWWAADLPNFMYLSGFSREQSRAFQARARREGREVETWLTWPYFPPEGNEVLQAIGREFAATGGFSDMLAAGEDAEATGFDVAWQLMDRRVVEAAADRGMGVAVWTVNDPKLAKTLKKWPVDVLISDYPGGPK